MGDIVRITPVALLSQEAFHGTYFRLGQPRSRGELHFVPPQFRTAACWTHNLVVSSCSVGKCARRLRYRLATDWLPTRYRLVDSWSVIRLILWCILEGDRWSVIRLILWCILEDESWSVTRLIFLFSLMTDQSQGWLYQSWSTIRLTLYSTRDLLSWSATMLILCCGFFFFLSDDT